MPTLSRDLRKLLERSVLAAREIAEKGAAEAVESFGIRDAKVPSHLDEAGRLLRRKLRAHGRQVGDKLLVNDAQEIVHLVQECAYEHWHRMLFARFLAENDLLRHPELGVPLSLNECQDLAREQNLDVWELAGQFAQKMLPEIFRSDDPVLSLRLPAESRNKLLKVLNDIPQDVFKADDSLGWVYQFWQAKRKEEVNASGVKIGADEIAPVTQLFTEDYMVEFLLHNTLGAWWVAKRLLEGKINQDVWKGCQTEEDCRRIAEIGPVKFQYLRFIKQDNGQWFPAAGGFEGWPRSAKELRVLDPCMGSGHFLVFALPILVAFRQEEEHLSSRKACIEVLRDNLFGLEIDPRCAQIAAFNLALTAWKLYQYQTLPSLNLACSGFAPNACEKDWIDLIGKNENLKFSLSRLYELFQKAPYLGSLINPREDKAITFSAPFQELLPYLEKAVALEADDIGHEIAVSAKGMAKAAEILDRKFTLVITNVPYLGRGKQNDYLQKYCADTFPLSKSDLAIVFLERCLDFCTQGCSAALVTPQSWLFLNNYEKFRTSLLNRMKLDVIARLGVGAFETISGEVVNIALVSISNTVIRNSSFLTLDVAQCSSKAIELQRIGVNFKRQTDQLRNPQARIVLDAIFDPNKKRLGDYCVITQGSSTGDDAKFVRTFWEQEDFTRWKWFMSSPDSGCYSGRSLVWDWPNNKCALSSFEGARVQGFEALNKNGFVVSASGRIVCGIYQGDYYNKALAALIPHNSEHSLAIWSFFMSGEFESSVRKLDQKLMVTPGTFKGVPFDLNHWQQVSKNKHLKNLPPPYSDDPTQWLFSGYPKKSDVPLQVAVARLLGYRWPRQMGYDFPDCPALGADGLETFADDDGIVCLVSLRGESTAADRLRTLLAASYGSEWTPIKEKELITAAGSTATNLDDWLRDDFFAQHCILFHHRPFVWHIWDGRRDGFHALVNYHRLAEGNGAGRRTLEALLYSYLGDWITRQRDAVKRNEAGADGRLAAALELQEELKKILAGEPPYDIFVRWKPLSKQAIGWEPDIDDGVRVNIRPFMMANLSKGKKGAGVLRDRPNIKWEKDRGKEPVRDKKDYPWFWGCADGAQDFLGGSDFDGNRWNSCHYSNTVKRKARE